MLKEVLAIAVLFAATSIAHAQQGDARRGEKVFENCRACHAADGKSNDVGPALQGVVGRKAGEREDFRYSPALKRSNIVWNAKTLDAFIADPQQVVPGNRMPYSGLPDAKERADLIAYLVQAFK
jgi:cytochrome c